jgi:hypothetical protein
MMQGFNLGLNNDLAGQEIPCLFHLQPEDLSCRNKEAISVIL